MIDLRDVEVYHTFTPTNNYIRVTHIQTGRTAEAQGEGYFETRWEALRLLEEKLNADKVPPSKNQ